MIVYKPKQAILLKPRDPNKYTTIFPKAKVIDVGDSKLVAIPHRPDETLVLRNMGINAPSPMNIYYPYNGRFSPFEAQKATAQFASMNRRGFILNSMGLGKTITTLWAMDYLRSIKQVHRVLVVCPISVMERTWADEIFMSFPTLKVNVLYGTRDKRLKMLADEADVYIINTDGIGIIQDALADRPDIDLVVIDEVALFRNQGTARWKIANDICNKQCNGFRRVWGLTGSPIPNAPTDAFGQIKLVTPGNKDCPKYFGRFRDLVMLNASGPYSSFPKWEPKPDAVQTVYKLMQPSIRFALDDVLDLPPQIITDRKVELTSEQKRAYRDMLNKLAVEAAEGQIVAVNEAVKASKLLQIACGVAYGQDGDEKQQVTFDCTERMAVVDEVVNESEGKTIVFVPFSGALNKLKDYLVGKGHTVAVVDGDTSKHDRDNIFRDFQKSSDPKVIVANPSTMSHGLTLTAATTICWYGPSYSNEVYQQACARVRRPGQKRSTVIVHFVSTPLEERIYQRIRDKQSIQGSLLDLVRDSAKSSSKK